MHFLYSNRTATTYCIAETFGGGKLWRFAMNLPKFYPPIAFFFKAWAGLKFTKVFFAKCDNLVCYSSKFSPTKIFHYTVACAKTKKKTKQTSILKIIY